MFNTNRKKKGTSSGGGYQAITEINLEVPEAKVETLKERAFKQRQKRREELTYTEEDQARWARNRERVIASKLAVDEQVRLLNSKGLPLANSPYFIVTSEKTFQGVSDKDGYLPRVTTAKKEEIKVYLGVLALEKWG